MEEQKKKGFTVNDYRKDIVAFLFVMYRSNMLSRNNIRQMFKVIKDDNDVDIVAFFKEDLEKGLPVGRG